MFDRGGFPGAEDNLEMNGAASGHIVEASRARGVDPAVPNAVLNLVEAAIGAGHGRDGFSRVVDVIRHRRDGAA